MLIDNKTYEKQIRTATEYVQQEKTAKILATYIVTNGLKLFAYNHIHGTIKEVFIQRGTEAHIIPDGKGGLTYYDPMALKCNVDAKDTHFEALNYKTAQNRVEKFQSGKIAELCNLRIPSDKSKLKKHFGQL